MDPKKKRKAIVLMRIMKSYCLTYETLLLFMLEVWNWWYHLAIMKVFVFCFGGSVKERSAKGLWTRENISFIDAETVYKEKEKVGIAK